MKSLWMQLKYIVLLVLASLMLLIYYTSIPVTLNSNRKGNNSNSQTFVCSFKPAELSSFIWSHRAHYPDNPLYNDGSMQSLQALLNAGITNFDIDISTKDGIFYVAHPSLLSNISSDLKKWEKDILTLPSFLEKIGKHHRIKSIISNLNALTLRPLQPFITCEPKFTDPKLWEELIMILQSSQYLPASHLAIIVSSPDQKTLVESIMDSYPHAPKIAIAIAYRSIPKTPNDFIWKDTEMALFRSQPMDLDSPYQYLHMPDVKLMTTTFKNPIGRSFHKPLIRIVPWLVDTPEGLLESLNHSVDGIISNNPIDLLHFLEDKYKRECVDIL